MIVINKIVGLKKSKPVTLKELQPRTQEACTKGSEKFVKTMMLRVEDKRDWEGTLVYE